VAGFLIVAAMPHLIQIAHRNTSAQACINNLEQIDIACVPAAKSNGYKMGGLEWDLLPVDFLQRVR
jgi:hypothetical protein